VSIEASIPPSLGRGSMQAPPRQASPLAQSALVVHATTQTLGGAPAPQAATPLDGRHDADARRSLHSGSAVQARVHTPHSHVSAPAHSAVVLHSLRNSPDPADSSSQPDKKDGPAMSAQVHPTRGPSLITPVSVWNPSPRLKGEDIL
jgi:hypothetical protein